MILMILPLMLPQLVRIDETFGAAGHFAGKRRLHVMHRPMGPKCLGLVEDLSTPDHRTTEGLLVAVRQPLMEMEVVFDGKRFGALLAFVWLVVAGMPVADVLENVVTPRGDVADAVLVVALEADDLILLGSIH